MRKYFLLILIFLGAVVFWTQNVKPPRFDTIDTVPTVTASDTIKHNLAYVQINNVKIPVEIAKTPAEVRKGLSGRESLDAKNGMLFIFAQPDYYSFWMPNMNFPIDIIWIAQDTIVGIHENVSNIFDPKNPKFYTPPKPVDKVLEINAGLAQKKNIKVGDPFNFVQGRPE